MVWKCHAMSAELDAPYLDAHLHLQDERLAAHLDQIVGALRAAGISRWVVNATCEADWPAVARLAEDYAEVVPCFGLHPWKVKQRSEQWRKHLRQYLERFANAGVGEIGLDKWIRGHDLKDQSGVLRDQLEMAVEYDRPAMIHCLRCFGTLRNLLVDLRSARGFPGDLRYLLHSYGGPKEMVEEFAQLGGYFSFSGYFLEPRKTDTRKAFAEVPIDRLLIESDAPDMLLPIDLQAISLAADTDGTRLNHPANVPVIYRELAKLRKVDESCLARQVAVNFSSLVTTNSG